MACETIIGDTLKKLAPLSVGVCIMMGLAAPCAAHVDTVLSVDANGIVSGLPPEYSPASVSVEYGRGIASIRVVVSLSISVANSHSSIPGCLLNALRLGEDQELRFLASWYHTLSELPPYMVIEFRKDDHDIGFAGHSVVLALDDLEVLMITRHQITDLGRTNDRLELSSFCPASELPDDSQDTRHY